MSNINYTIDDLHHMVNLGVRGNMVCDNIYKQMMPDVVDRYFDNLVTKSWSLIISIPHSLGILFSTIKIDL